MRSSYTGSDELISLIAKHQEELLLDMVTRNMVTIPPNIDTTVATICSLTAAICANILGKECNDDHIVLVAAAVFNSSFKLSPKWEYTHEDYTKMKQEIMSGIRNIAGMV